MLQTRIDTLLKSLKFQINTIAKHGGIDRTMVSRFRTGNRKLSENSVSIHKLAKGILGTAKEKDKMTELCSFMQSAAGIYLSSEMSDEEIEIALEQYLAEDKTSKQADRSFNSMEEENGFGERLDACMTLAMITNVRLSRALNVDASLISRYRSGSRSPRSNPQIMRDMGVLLFERIIATGKLAELSVFTGIEEQKLDVSEFTNWLFQMPTNRKNITEAARSLIYTLDSFSSAAGSEQQISGEMLAQAGIENDVRTVYYGTEGLRQASLRLLKQAISDGARELWLYSDCDMSWMTEDKKFWMKWSVLMGACVQKKIHMHIVHHLNRRPDEMVSAIRGWLPLYMSGMVDSYYCIHDTHIGFSHVLFVCPGIAVVEACNVIGTEENGRYRYHEEQEELDFQMAAFNEFLVNARPLVRVFQKETEEMQKALCILRPDEMLIHSDLDMQKLPMQNFEFKNVEIRIGEEFVSVKRLQNDAVIFYIAHPYMVEAFKTFVQLLEERVKGDMCIQEETK